MCEAAQPEITRREVTMEKQPYVKPTITTLGSVSDLTQTGITQPGPDAKSGSAASQGT
jgi:hypothetical protein